MMVDVPPYTNSTLNPINPSPSRDCRFRGNIPSQAYGDRSCSDQSGVGKVPPLRVLGSAAAQLRVPLFTRPNDYQEKPDWSRDASSNFDV